MSKGIHTGNIMSERKQDSITIDKVEQSQVVSELNGKELDLAIRRAELLQSERSNGGYTR